MKFPRILIVGLLSLQAASAGAQVDLQNNGTLFISGSGGLLHVNGSLVNSSTGSFTNNGNVYIKNDFYNAQSSMAVGTGTLTMNGNAAQNINGTQVINTFNLVTNNTAGLTLNNDLSVSGVHTFTAGLIHSSSTPNYLRYEAGSSYTGNDDTKHVTGWVSKSGSTSFIFPVGNLTSQRTIAISNLTASSVFNARYAGVTTNTGNLAAPLVTVDPNEYWFVNKVSGGSAVVDMNWDNSKVAIPHYQLADMRVANYISSNWTAVGGTGSGNILTTGTISSNVLASFGAFTFGSISALVPMHLLRFTAARSNGNAVLNWTTTDEKELGGFQPQRSADGINFSSIGSVTPNNGTGVQHYSFTDRQLPIGLIYYRLRTNDLDGKQSYSQIVTIENRPEAMVSIINPAISSIRIATGTLNGPFNYQLRTNAGQIIQSGTLELTGPYTSLPIKSSIAPGIYFLQLQSKTVNYTGRVIKQ